MSYRLEHKEPLLNGVKRIALQSLTELPEGIDEAVHDARKRFKKVRALLRLMRDEIGDAGRHLSAVRDSAVMVETLGYVSEREQMDSDLVTAIRQRLIHEHEAMSERVLYKESALAIVMDTITQAQRRVDRWPLEKDDFTAFSGGLRRVYKRGRKRFANAKASPSTDNLHEWRKRGKYLWYNVRILKPLWPAVLTEFADEVHDLSDVLGLDHDLAVFLERIVDLPEFPDGRAADSMAAFISHQRADLQAEARSLGERIYAEKPKAFVKRFTAYWEAWQAA